MTYTTTPRAINEPIKAMMRPFPVYLRLVSEVKTLKGVAVVLPDEVEIV